MEAHRPRRRASAPPDRSPRDPIVMTAEDVAEVASRVPAVVAVHLEAINHCVVTRAEVRSAAPTASVPEDGETVEL